MIIKPSPNFEGSELPEPVPYSGVDVAQLIEEQLGTVIWISQSEGFCTCPGRHLHSGRDAKKDCKFYLLPVPTVACFHSSCRVTIEETNRRMRGNLRGIVPELPIASKAEQKAMAAKVYARDSLRRRAASARERLLRDFHWPYRQIAASSPDLIPDDPRIHWRELIQLFAPDDVLWIGDLYDSGSIKHTANFRPRREWEDFSGELSQFTCPCSFKQGSYARSNNNISRRDYLVVESDELDRDTIGAVFRWMREGAKLELMCIIDTGGKSLHAWFQFPAEEALEELRIMLPELGCDPRMFTASQPCRLAGARRGARFQQLIYLNKGGSQ